ncbi:DUF881 domain-containing protein, partial [Streptomyces hygroscopicus]|uniref:DUF881 domain-containing protein n=1 Tax=Streptomyces hygroscopicus TaxID=1912 RepID=UPI0036C035D4
AAAPWRLSPPAPPPPPPPGAPAAPPGRARGGRARPPPPAPAKLGLALGLVLVAVVITIGAAEARISAPTLAKEREELIDRIETGNANADKLARSVETLRGEVGEKQRQALKKDGGDKADLAALLAGADEVVGPGVKLVVNDAKEATSGGGGPRGSADFSDTGRVRDHDMQRVVNGLWESGAEAVSINGQRLTALSAIRAAGDAILVDNKPLAPPYTVLAVGDGQRLSTAFQDSVDGQYLHVLQQNYHIRTSISVQDSLRLPAAPSLIVRTAEPIAGGSGKGDADTGKGTS